MILSVVIPARSEFPNIIHTIYSILHSWEASGFSNKEIEIIIVDNCSMDDNFYPQRGTKGTTSYVMPRGMYWDGVVRVVRDPIAGNHSARNKGAEIARGKYLFFSDAHMAYSPQFFKYMIQATDETNGIVHAPIGWMGAYPPMMNDGNPHGLGFQYTIKLGEEIKGCVDEETEILTRTGWKKWNEVSYDTEFATVKMAGKDAKTIEYQKPRDLVIKDWDGDMIRIKHRNYDALLTPNHRCYYQSPELRSHIKNGTRSEYEWRVKFVENLTGEESLPIATKGVTNTCSILKDEMVALIGWIITEGCYDKDTITITQFKKNHRRTIEELLNKLGISYCLHGKKRDFKIHQNDSAFIKGILPNKKLTPEFLGKCSRKQLEILYTTLIDGDGTREGKQEHFIQVDKETLDSFQMLCVLLGKQSKVVIRKFTEKHQHYGTKPIGLVSIKRSSHAKDFTLTREQYKGKVWCPDLENGNIFIRRNGQTAITGNTWNPYCLQTDKWFYIPALGHCSVMVKRDQFIEFGGYPKVHRSYGGGEFYLNMKWWMFGSSVAVEPRAIGYHLSSGRGYTYDHNDYVHNVINIGMQLDMMDWTERAWINWLRTHNEQKMLKMWKEAEEETAEDKAFVIAKRKKTFNEVIVEQPWNKQNEQLYGKSNGQLSIFHDTWLPLISGTPAEKYYPGKYQEGLEKFINENLSQYVYKRN